MSDIREALPEIELQPPDADKPLFTIVRRGPLTLLNSAAAADAAGVRPCSHSRFFLDDEWMTVTCAECKQRVEPYAVLRFNAGIIEKSQHERRMKEHAELRLLQSGIREMLKRSCFTDEERDRGRRETYFVGGKYDLAYFRQVHTTLQNRVWDAKAARRKNKRHPLRQVLTPPEPGHA